MCRDFGVSPSLALAAKSKTEQQSAACKFTHDASDALVLPSHFEGLPNVVLEAMALGTPVIATRSGGTIELQRDQPTILWAEPNTPSSLADALLAFAKDRSAARWRAENAKALIAQHHDATKTTRLIESFLS